MSLFPILIGIGLILSIINVFFDTERKTLSIYRILGMNQKRMFFAIFWDKVNTILLPFVLSGICCFIATKVINVIEFGILDYFLLIIFFTVYLLIYSIMKSNKIFKTDLSKLGAFI